MMTTREILINAARKLFGQMGITNTTINDVAVESQKGRRTVYTYFKNKDELLDAVIEEEMQFVVSSLEQIMKQNMDPLNKFIAYTITRMNVIRTVVQRNGSLHSEFFRDVIKVELVRRKLEKIEVKNLKEILKEGVEKNVFDISSLKGAAIFAHFIMRGIDIPYIRGTFDDIKEGQDVALERKIRILLQGIIKQPVSAII
ncbi:MAG: TetR/AcrR family transcriptional regulator [Bacteroidales bacterium]|jgi:AcrR family transcriptional regulator|nr:TetR/AcrR family transcriptional regulator [Bacteroidales bacterium]